MVQAENLSRLGFEVVTAMDGESAVESAKADPNIALVLMDIDLGRGIDGTEAARRILAGRKLPIVFLTSHAEQEMVEKVRDITRYGYVFKDSGDFVLQSSIEMAFQLFDAHERLSREENSLRALIQTIPDLIWLKNTEGVYLRCNWMFERFFGAAEAEIVGKTDFDFVDEELASFFRERDRVAMEAGIPTRNEEEIIFAADGRRALLETIKTPLKDECGNTVGILGVGRDITERKRTEEMLERSEEALKKTETRIRTTIESIRYPPENLDGIELKDIIDAPLLERIMRDFYTLTGMNIGLTDTAGNTLVSVGNQDICAHFHRKHPATLAYCLESNAELTGAMPTGNVREYRCGNSMRDVSTPIYIGSTHFGNIKTGQFFYEDEEVDFAAFAAQARRYGFDEAAYLEALRTVPRLSRERVQATMRFYSELAGLIGRLSYRNLQLAGALNERDRLYGSIRDSEERFRVIANYTVDWESWFGPDGKCLWVNPGVEKVTGYTPAEILAMPDFINALIPEDIRAEFRERFDRAIGGSSGNDFEFRFLHKSGEKRWLSVSWQSIYDGDGSFLGIRTSGRDITERKNDREMLARSNEEKEVLLRELKHRVKNSLALVSSLLSLNKSLIVDARDARILNEAIDRIKSISAIYEQLNFSESLDRIEIDAYIRSLVRMLESSYTIGTDRIRFVERIAKISVPMKLAVPVGIIANELITNAIKYAYPRGAEGEVRIELEADGNSAVLRVSDDGPGLPADFDIGTTDSLGLRIAGMLARQIGGKLVFGHGPGAAASVAFRL